MVVKPIDAGSTVQGPERDQGGSTSSVDARGPDADEASDSQVTIDELRRREARWRTLIENMADTVTVVDADGIVSSASGEVSEVLGHPPSSWVGRDLHEMVHPDDRAALAPEIERVTSVPGATTTTRCRVRRADGSWADIWVHAVNLLDDPAVGGIVLTTRNVTEERRSQQLLSGHARLLEDLARATPIDEVLADVAGLVESQVPRSQVAVAVIDGDRLRLHAHPDRGPSAALRSALTGHAITPDLVAAYGGRHGVPSVHDLDSFSGPSSGTAEDEGAQTMWWAPVVLPEAEQASAAIVGFHRDRFRPSLHDRRAIEVASSLVALALDRHATISRLAHRALHDDLTGLPNRTLLLDRLELALERSRRAGRELGVICVDLDRFKTVNTGRGLATGDAVLVEVADRLRRQSRPGDTIARVGADEFVVVCERIGGAPMVLSLADRLAEAIRAPIPTHDGDVVLTASIGVALGTVSVDPGTLLRHADQAMMRAKKVGRNRIEVFDPAMQASAHDRAALAADLRRAVGTGQLRLAYQPIVSLPTGRIVGAEVLCRWHHPTRGQVPPEVFIPIAEETGAIRALGSWVVATALEEMAVLGRADAPDDATALGLHINLSPLQLDDPELLPVLDRAVRANGWRPDQICLELTETAITDDLDLATGALVGLRATGVRIAIDDFGTGYSSLSHLQRLPLDAVKIDRSFVSSIGEVGETGAGRDRSAIVGAIVGMASAMGLQAVAEGIETTAQLEELRALGCRLGQGYLLSAPVAAPALLATLGDPAPTQP